MNQNIIPYFLDNDHGILRSNSSNVELMALVEEQESGLKIRFHGSLGLENHRELRRVLEDVLARTSRNQILVDLSRVTSISSSGFGALVDFRHRLQGSQRSLRLCNLSADCRQVLHLLNLNTIFDIC
ncbi:MAG: STAS domain-containing protein [Leptospiraceae bacterium]|nr:STAS domain-containing protein [Leptospiraceae bacterium]